MNLHVVVSCLLHLLVSGKEDPTNVIMIMIDDIGRADIGAYGSEWDTPNIDSFISSSVTLSHHYIGYVCSASRSQFLTGRYSYHNGYGTLNVFDVDRLGAIPSNTPTLMEFLSKYGNYKTYGIGKWQLGSTVETQLAYNRGFDKFIGFNGGLEHYFKKTNNKLLDFWDDLEITSDYSNGYSTDQYFDLILSTLDEHDNINDDNDDDNDDSTSPFFMYVGLQATHMPYPDHDDESYYTPYYETCVDKYSNNVKDFENRIDICEAVLGIDEGIRKLMKYFEESIAHGSSLWDNTLIILTSDNGGAINSGSCNYPLRGGKNTFFEGGQRVISFVGGGKISESSQRGKVLDGLISNVDWFPTILSFAGLIPQDSSHVRFHTIDTIASGNENENGGSITLELDGYNMHNYLLGYDSSPVRDHIMFHIKPQLDSETSYWLDDNGGDITNYRLGDMDEIAIIFYDDNGKLWKYLDVSVSKNEIGDPNVNSGWCEKIDNKYSVYYDDDSAVLYGLYELTSDISERLNYFENDDNLALLDEITSQDTINKIIDEKISFYVNEDSKGSHNSKFLFGDFECFTTDEIDEVESASTTAAAANDAWVPYYDEDEFGTVMVDNCGMDKYHPIFKLHTTAFEWPKDIEIIDNSDAISKLNSRVPRKTTVNELSVSVNGLQTRQPSTKILISMLICVLILIFAFGAIIRMHMKCYKCAANTKIAPVVSNDEYRPIRDPVESM